MSNAVLPILPGLAWNIHKRPVFRTRVQRSVGGWETRIAQQMYPMWEFELPYEFLRSSAAYGELQTLMGFYLRRQGSYDDFLYSDPSDNSVTAQPFGTGDGTTTAFQLSRSYGGFSEPVQNLNGAPVIYRQDWQGNQLLYAVARKNSLNYTIALNKWSTSTIAVLPNAALAPDGTYSMDMLVNTGSIDCYIQQQVPVTANSTNIFSIFVKQGTAACARLRVPYVGGTTYDTVIDFNFSTGNWVAGYPPTLAPSAPVNLGNGIWRLAAAFTDTGSNNTADVRVAPMNAAGGYTPGQTLYVWGADFKLGTSVLSSYIPSADAVTSRASVATYYNSSGVLQTAAVNVARYGYDPATLVSQGLIIEAAGTNLALQSQAVGATPWAYLNSTGALNSGAALAPDATSSATLWSDGTAAGVPHVVSQTATITANGVYNFSIYAKQATGLRYITLHIDDNYASGLYAIFDLQTGAIAAPISVSGTAVAGFATITPVNNGWYRCSISGICSTTATTARIAVSGGLTANPSWYEVYTGANNSVYLWGAQFEAGYVPTSYIATTTAAAARAADVATSTARTVTDYSVSESGLVTFDTAPAYNATLTWTGTYYYRVRFAEDNADFNNMMQNLWELKKLNFLGSPMNKV